MPVCDAACDAKPLGPGDWNCPRCRAVVFASKQNCFKCNTPNPNPSPNVSLRIGQEQKWECSGCFALVPGHIKKCNCGGGVRPGTVADPPELSDAEKKQLESIEREMRQGAPTRGCAAHTLMQRRVSMPNEY